MRRFAPRQAISAEWLVFRAVCRQCSIPMASTTGAMGESRITALTDQVLNTMGRSPGGTPGEFPTALARLLFPEMWSTRITDCMSLDDHPRLVDWSAATPARPILRSAGRAWQRGGVRFENSPDVLTCSACLAREQPFVAPTTVVTPTVDPRCIRDRARAGVAKALSTMISAHGRFLAAASSSRARSVRQPSGCRLCS